MEKKLFISVDSNANELQALIEELKLLLKKIEDFELSIDLKKN